MITMSGARSPVGRGIPPFAFLLIANAPLPEKISSPYQRPISSRPLFRPAQSNFPFLATVILIKRKNCIGHLKVSVGGAEEAGSITSTRKLMRRGFADRAMEDH